MLFTWDTENLCIIFRQWRVTGTVSFLLSLLGVIALTAGYEFVREMSRQHEQRYSSEAKTSSSMYRTSTWLFPGSTRLIPLSLPSLSPPSYFSRSLIIYHSTLLYNFILLLFPPPI